MLIENDHGNDIPLPSRHKKREYCEGGPALHPGNTLNFGAFKQLDVYCHQIALLKLKFKAMENNFHLLIPTKREKRFWL